MDVNFSVLDKTNAYQQFQILKTMVETRTKIEGKRKGRREFRRLNDIRDLHL